MKKLRHSDGFGILETVVTAAIMLEVGLFGAQMLSQNLAQQKSIEQTASMSLIASEARGILAMSGVCTNNFLGLNPTQSTNITQINDLNSQARFSVNQMIDGVQIKSLVFGGGFTALIGTQTGSTNLAITMQKIVNQKPVSVTKNVSLVTTIDGAGNVTTCSPYNNDNTGYWTKNLADNSISYQTGNVGIGGTADSTSALRLVGSNSSKVVKLESTGISSDVGVAGTTGLQVNSKDVLVNDGTVCRSDGTGCPTKISCGLQLYDCEFYTAISFWCGLTGTSESCVQGPDGTGNVRVRCPGDRLMMEVDQRNGGYTGWNIATYPPGGGFGATCCHFSFAGCTFSN